MTHEDKGHLEVEDRGAVQIVRSTAARTAVRPRHRQPAGGVWWTGSTATRASMPSSSPGRIPSGSSAMPTSGGCRKRAPRARRSAGAAPPPSRARPEARTAPASSSPWCARPRCGEPSSSTACTQTFLRMNRSGVIFVAALNGSALGLGAEFAWACDLRVMADGDFFIGQPEVLLGIIPGGGGTQRLTRLIGTHRSLVAILEGKPFTPAEALANGAVDEVVPQDEVIDAGDRARRTLRLAVQGVGRGGQEVGVLRRLDVAGRKACTSSAPSSSARSCRRTARS